MADELQVDDLAFDLDEFEVSAVILQTDAKLIQLSLDFLFHGFLQLK